MLGKIRCKIEPLALTILRIVFGIIMTFNGYDKLINISAWKERLTEMDVPLPGISVYFLVGGEFFAGLGLIVGFLTPIAAFGVFFTMLVALIKVHVPQLDGDLTLYKKYEYPLILMVTAFYFMIRGAGCISLDWLVMKLKKPKKQPETKT